MSNLRDTSKELRDLLIFSGSDHFMGGHQIINSNRSHVGYRRASADWSQDDDVVRELLLRVFPKLESNEKQRVRAGRWMRIIHLFYRAGLSYGDVAEEMKSSLSTVRSALQHIRRAAKGRPCNRSIKNFKRRATSKTSLGATSESSRRSEGTYLSQH